MIKVILIGGPMEGRQVEVPADAAKVHIGVNSGGVPGFLYPNIVAQFSKEEQEGAVEVYLRLPAVIGEHITMLYVHNTIDNEQVIDMLLLAYSYKNYEG